MILGRASKRGKRKARRGQSEVIGGLIVLTLLFAFAVPMILNSYNSTVQMTSQIQQTLQAQKTHYNEKIEIKPLDPNNEAYIRAGWIPGVFINNTGTVAVTIERLYLVNKENNTIYKVYDLRYARETTTPDIDVMLVDVDLVGGGQPPPPVGQPITLKPGENLLIVFNETILPFAPHLVVLVESANGVMHPLVGTGTAKTLYPGRPGSGTGGGAPPGAWRGIFAPQSGFKLEGAYELDRSGYAYAWTPPANVWPEVWTWRGWRLSSFNYYTSFIYNDPDYPGLYYLYIRPAETIRVRIDSQTYGCGDATFYAYSNWLVLIKGYVGTYDTGGDGTYFNGWAYEVRVYDSNNYLRYSWSCSRTRYLGASDRVTWADFDGNGINELVLFSYLNGPNIASTYNNDMDSDGDIYKDAGVWTYMISRDISGVDFIKITAKINYYWTTVFSSATGCPDWNYRHLKTFAIVVWQYDEETGTWEVYHFKDFSYTTDKPVQYQPVVTFPVDRTKTYRVGVMFFDNYRDWDGYGYWCHTDFTYTIEHMIVEYGVLNPYFQESPPLYIIAIPDPNLISGIGERDFALAYNLSDINEAKVRAQDTLLSMLEDELNYAGISGYTIIRTQQEACDLLFGDTPPKYAVVIWLQGGNVSVPYVLYTAYGFGCTAASSDEYIFQRIKDYHWVWVWPMETPFASPSALQQYNNVIKLTSYGNYTANITEQGINVRIKMYAFYLFNTLKFKHLIYFESPSYEYLLISNGTFYTNETSTGTVYYGTSAYWVYVSGSGGPGTGAIVLNPVHLDWDVSGDGVVPDTLVQQIIYAALETWNYVIENT